MSKENPMDGISKALSGKGKKANRGMVEAIILSKLYKDGFFIVDEKKKRVVIDVRKSRIVEMYKESSYRDIRGIMERTGKGMKLNGYKVKLRWLEDSASEVEKVIDSAVDRAETED
jgi:hypothetical protein